MIINIQSRYHKIMFQLNVLHQQNFEVTVPNTSNQAICFSPCGAICDETK